LKVRVPVNFRLWDVINRTEEDFWFPNASDTDQPPILLSASSWSIVTSLLQKLIACEQEGGTVRLFTSNNLNKEGHYGAVKEAGVSIVAVFALLSMLTFSATAVEAEESTWDANVCSQHTLITGLDLGFVEVNTNYYASSHGFDLCDIDGWTIALSGELDVEGGIPGGSVGITCTSGGEQDCPLLVWCNLEVDELLD